MTSSTLIQLFTKPPLPGQVKTRLIPEIGQQSATAIYKHCLQSNLNMLQQTKLDYQVWLTQPSDHEVFNGLNIHLQQGNDLGQRMLHALASVLSNSNAGDYNRVILIGSDCLEITSNTIRRVQAKLNTHDLVLIPALDGGYVLIAAKNNIDARLFDSIDWSTEQVLLQTVHIAMDLAIATAVLNPLRDIDRVDDVRHYPQLIAYLGINED